MKRWSVIVGTLAFAASVAPAATPNNSWLINGTVVDRADFPEVVQIQTKVTEKDPLTGKVVTGIASCSATVVGPHAILTAAHCGDTNSQAKFKIGSHVYTAVLHRSKDFVEDDLTGEVGVDLSVGVVDEELPVTPVSVGGKAKVGLGLTLLGYGCTHVGGGGGNDGTLRMGETVVTKLLDLDMTSKQPGGSALCSGDSGGPTYVDVDGETYQIGVHSRGNLKDTNIDLRTDLPDSVDFLTQVAQQENVDICGVTKQCKMISTDRERN